jgi:general secretion pathway protein J
MTLIEVLVALSLLSMLSVGLISTFRIGQKSYMGVVRADRTYWDVANAQRVLRRALESLYPGSAVDGRREALSLTAPMAMAAGGSGFYRYELAVQNGDLRVRANSREEVLVANVKTAEWAYWDASLDEPRWVVDWTDKRHPPALIRLRITFPERDSRRWPDLIVDPRITDDVRCEFDVVAQACREESE